MWRHWKHVAPSNCNRRKVVSPLFAHDLLCLCSTSRKLMFHQGDIARTLLFIATLFAQHSKAFIRRPRRKEFSSCFKISPHIRPKGKELKHSRIALKRCWRGKSFHRLSSHFIKLAKGKKVHLAIQNFFQKMVRRKTVYYRCRKMLRNYLFLKNLLCQSSECSQLKNCLHWGIMLLNLYPYRSDNLS